MTIKIGQIYSSHNTYLDYFIKIDSMKTFDKISKRELIHPQYFFIHSIDNFQLLTDIFCE